MMCLLEIRDCENKEVAKELIREYATIKGAEQCFVSLDKELADLDAYYEGGALLIAHDLAVVKNVCDRVAVMERGRFVDQGETTDVFERPESPYTRRLLAAVPRIMV